MKNILILLLSILTLSLVSCDKDDDPQPQPQTPSVVTGGNETGDTTGLSTGETGDTGDNYYGGTIENPVIKPTNDTIYLIEPSDKYGTSPGTYWPSINREFEGEQSLLANDIYPYDMLNEDNQIETVSIKFNSSDFIGNYGPTTSNAALRPNYFGTDADPWGWTIWTQRSDGGTAPFIDTFDVEITLKSGDSYETKLYVYHWSYNPNY